MIVAYYSDALFPGVIVRALPLLGCDEVAILSGLATSVGQQRLVRILPLVLRAIQFAKLIRIPITGAKQEAAAFVRVGLLAVTFDPFQLLPGYSNRHIRGPRQ